MTSRDFTKRHLDKGVRKFSMLQCNLTRNMCYIIFRHMKNVAQYLRPMYLGLNRSAGGFLFVIVVLATGVRLWGIGAGLPYVYHPDEPHYVQISQDILKHNDLDPHFFNYPSLFFYLNTLIYIPFFFVGKLLGSLVTLDSIPTPSVEVLGIGYTSMPATFLAGRCLTVAFGVGSVILIYYIGSRLTRSKLTGLLASFFLAISTTNVTNSRFITPDTQVTFFILLSFLGCVLIYQRGKTKYYVLAGIAAGLAISSKYNGALILVALLGAHFLAEDWLTALKDRRIYLAFLLVALSFLATTPFLIFDFSRFYADISAEFVHYSTGHDGSEGNSLTWYVEYLWANEGIVVVLALAETVRACWSRYAPGILVSLFPGLYFVFINLFTVRNDRTLLPVIPFLLLLGASFLSHLLKTRPALQPVLLPNGRLLMQKSVPEGGSPASAGLTLALVAAIFLAIQTVSNTNIALASIAQKDEVRVWIDEHLPHGSMVAVESYAAYIDPQNFTVDGVSRMINYDANWYKAEGFQYLVFSAGMFGRYYNERVRYAPEVAQYDNLFRSFSLVQTFPDEVNEIRIYEVNNSVQIRGQ